MGSLKDSDALGLSLGIVLAEEPPTGVQFRAALAAAGLVAVHFAAQE